MSADSRTSCRGKLLPGGALQWRKWVQAKVQLLSSAAILTRLVWRELRRAITRLFVTVLSQPCRKPLGSNGPEKLIVCPASNALQDFGKLQPKVTGEMICLRLRWVRS